MKIKTLVIIALLLTPIFGNAKKTKPEKVKRIYHTTRIQGNAPVIDGIGQEDVWNTVEWSGDFIQKSPEDGGNPSQETVFKVLYDDDFLYFLIRSYDTEPEKIVKRLSRRDGFDGDWVEINIDSYFDKRTAFSFTASVSGVKGDEAISNDGRRWDSTWDPIWHLKTSVDKDGWVAEIKIPFTQLRFSNTDENQVWGIQVTRRVFRKEERSQWAYFSNDESGYVRHFGELHGINNIKPKRQLEVSPYIVAKQENFNEEIGNPYKEDGYDRSLGIGLDGKVGITNDFTLDFTINPDFGQVEADPSEVNLTAFESYFSEKRPFFIENRNITNYQISRGGPYWRDNLFYSRRIGRSPCYYPDVQDGEYADIPKNTTILGALKISGKTKKGLSIGIIESLAAEEKAKISDGDNEREQVVEPLTNYFVSRIQKDLNDNNTIVGGMFTSTNRFINDDHLDGMNTDAYTGGVDFTQYFNDKKYSLTTRLSMSHIQGDTTAILSQQTSSRRYFQRPDNDYTSLDSNRTSLTGHAGTIQFEKNTHNKWHWGAWLTWRSPEYELNDVGYMRQSDGIFQVIYGGYRWSEPFSIFRNLNIGFDQWSNWDFGLNNSYYGISTNTWMTFKNHYSFGAGFNMEGNGNSNTALRGGPALKTTGGGNYWINVGTDRRKKVRIHFNTSRSWGFEDSRESQRYGIGIIYRPIDALRLSFMPNYSVSRNELQYVTTEEYNGEDRYVFAQINRVTTVLTARVDYSITPDLTIQIYASPFISSGNYSDAKYITNPQADKFKERYSTNMSWSSNDYDRNYDFNFKQFRANAVLRWEYRPGSLLYLVWSPNMTGYDSTTGAFSFADDMGDLFSIKPESVFLAKLSFRLSN